MTSHLPDQLGISRLTGCSEAELNCMIAQVCTRVHGQHVYRECRSYTSEANEFEMEQRIANLRLDYARPYDFALRTSHNEPLCRQLRSDVAPQLTDKRSRVASACSSE